MKTNIKNTKIDSTNKLVDADVVDKSNIFLEDKLNYKIKDLKQACKNLESTNSDLSNKIDIINNTISSINLKSSDIERFAKTLENKKLELINEKERLDLKINSGKKDYSIKENIHNSIKETTEISNNNPLILIISSDKLREKQKELESLRNEIKFLDFKITEMEVIYS